MKVYCDTGAFLQELKCLQDSGIIELYTFKYENKNKNIKNSGVPSKATYIDLKNYKYNDLKGISYSDFSGSDKYEKIVSVLGVENRVDILHLDSAYKSQCEVFLTSDKHDIWKKREELLVVLGMHIFNVSEIKKCIDYINCKSPA
jgi:transposase